MYESIYKNKESNINEYTEYLNKLLSNLSVGDTKHDFGYNLDYLKSNVFSSAYNSGIPIPYNTNYIFDENQCLDSVIKTINNFE